MNKRDWYRSFKELAANEEPSTYNIIYQERSPEVVILAIHGGGIETGTGELAKVIAGNEFSFYIFEGKKLRNNYPSLHITSTNFDEENCLRLVQHSEITIAIHGMEGTGENTFIGGRDSFLKDSIAQSLNQAGFKATVLPDDHKFAGIQKENICNKNKRHMGVQLEIEIGLRNKFFRVNKRGMREKTQTASFYEYAEAIRMGLYNFMNHENGGNWGKGVDW